MDYNISLQEQKGSQDLKNTQSQPHPQSQQQHIEQIMTNTSHQSGQPMPPDPTQQDQQGNKILPTGCTKFCRLDYYEQFFQVGQGDVLARILKAFIPIKSQFIESLNNKPDFYGPFWLLTTIIFLVSSTGNLSRYFYNWTKDAYIFKLELVRYAVLAVYSFGFGIPTLLYLVTKFLGCTRLSLPQIICLYGYSFAPFIPIFLLCIIPLQAIQWLLIAYGMVNTSLFLIFNLKAYLEELEKPKIYLIFGIVVGGQVALFLTFKLVFFRMVYEEENSG